METIKNILISLTKFFLVLALVIPIAATILAFSYFSFTVGSTELTETQVVAIVLLVVLLFSSIVLLFPLGLFIDPSREKGLHNARSFLVILMIGFIGYLLIDTETFEEKYFLEDLQPKEVQSDNTLFLINTIISPNPISPFPDIQPLKNKEHYNNIEEHEETIIKAWESIKPYRLIIDQLVDYDTLYMPIEIEVDQIGNHIRFKDIGVVYTSYALLMAKQGHTDAMINYLSKVQKIARNGLSESLNLIQKMIWTSVLQDNLATAYHITLNYSLSKNELQQIGSIFSPLTLDELNFHKVWLGEYLFITHSIDSPLDKLIDSHFFLETKPRLLQVTPAEVKRTVCRLIYSPIMSKKLMAKQWYPVIEHSKEDKLVPQNMLVPSKEISTKVPLRNLLGWYLYRSSGDYVMYQNKSLEQKIRSELFSIYLNDLIKNQAIVYDYFSGEPNRLLRRDNTLISAGPDAEFNTKDDIVLEPIK